VIPVASPDQVREATRRYDAQLRRLPEWQRWQENEAYKYALVVDGDDYPVKQIIRMATGFTAFSGGDEANRYLQRLGFSIRRIRDSDGSPALDDSLHLIPGDTILRTELHLRYGGAGRGGIEPSRKSPNVFIFSDPEAGRRYGYNFDGFRNDRVHGRVFHYTGEGQLDDQRFVDGNKAILEHALRGRSLRVFQGVRGIVEYLGEFRLDEEHPFDYADAPDREGRPRQVIVFRLLPIDAIPSITLPPPLEPPRAPDVREIAVEEHKTDRYLVPAVGEREAARREQPLVQRYRTWLERRGRNLVRLRVIPEGEVQTLRHDLYDPVRNNLIEAKLEATRPAIRMAIGQLADYGRFRSEAARGVLLSHRPRLDLEHLLTSVNVFSVWEDQTGFSDNADGRFL